MSSKLIRLEQLQRFKTNADATYQDKLTAGSNITISNNVISAQTTVGQQTLYNATITASGWSGTSNTVSVQGVAAGDDVEIVGINPTGMSSADILSAKTALALITYGTTSANAITFYALNGVPSVDIPVTIRKIVNGTLSDGVYGNANITSYSIDAPANATTTIYTATGNCKVYVNAETKDNAETNAADVNLKINGNDVLSSRQAPANVPKYFRILSSTVLMEAGDVLSIQNKFASTGLQGSYRVVPAGSSQITAITDYSSEVVVNADVISNNPSYLDIKLIKQGRICVLSGFVRFVASAAADTTLFTVPTGALPSSIYTTATILGEITGDNTARNCQIVSSTGVFRMHNDATPSSGYMRFNGTYISET